MKSMSSVDKGHQTNNLSKEELMLVEQIIKETVDLQGFRVHTVTKSGKGLIAEIRPDARYSIRCGTCNAPARYRDRRNVRFFSACSSLEYPSLAAL